LSAGPRGLAAALALAFVGAHLLAAQAAQPGRLGDPHIALAYVDPGAGSYLLQILLAAVLGAAAVLRGGIWRAWHRLRDWVKARLSRPSAR
jgi:hypothetical protein